MSHTDDGQGRFGWQRRMGEHYAYHQRSANRWVHFACIPIELFAIMAAFACLPSIQGVAPAMFGLAAVTVIYMMAEPVAGLLMGALLLGLYQLSLPLVQAFGWWVLPASVGLFALSFNIQMGLGHSRLEPGTEVEGGLNFEEFFRTRNPIPLLLIFFYHVVEIVLRLGYRPQLKDTIARHMQAEVKRLGYAAHEEAWPR